MKNILDLKDKLKFLLVSFNFALIFLLETISFALFIPLIDILVGNNTSENFNQINQAWPLLQPKTCSEVNI